jgi:hypothetical protein
LDEQGRSLKKEVNVELTFYPPYLRFIDGDVRGVLFETRTVEACRKNALHMQHAPAGGAGPSWRLSNLWNDAGRCAKAAVVVCGHNAIKQQSES